MKLKTLLLALFTAGLAASFALAGEPPAPREGKMPVAAQEKASAAKDKGKEKAKAAKARAAKAKAARLGAKEEANVLDGCRPRVAFIFQGEFVSSSAGAEGTTLVAVLVKRGNAHAKRYAGKQVTVTVGDRTRVIRRGPAEASDLAAGDRLLVHVRGCKSADETMALYAKHVVAKPAAKDEDDEDDEDETTTSTTTATDTTTTTTTTP